jgi:hypothetical protein
MGFVHLFIHFEQVLFRFPALLIANSYQLTASLFVNPLTIDDSRLSPQYNLFPKLQLAAG